MSSLPGKPADRAVREQALDPACSFVVQAPAGSGKTELLIRRYLLLLSRVQDPEEIIAITFTRKAAAEMRSRVLRALEQANGPKPPDRYAAEIWEIANLARDNNRKRDWRLDQHPSRLRVLTIDSLCAYITRQMPWVSGMGAPPQVVENAGPLYAAAAEATVRLITSGHGEWSDAARKLLQHLDARVPRAVQLLVDMLSFRDQWLRHIGRPTGEDPERRSRLESVWRSQVRREMVATLELIAPEDRPDLLDCAVYAAGELHRLDRENAILSWLNVSVFPGDSLDDLGRWRGLREMLLTRDGNWRKRVNVNIGFPPGGGHAADMKQKMSDLLKLFAGDEQLREGLVRIGSVPDPGFDDRQWRIISALSTILPTAAAQLQVLFGETGQVDFTEISMRAGQALGSFGSPGDLALRMDHRISHLLVDEFQDTSVSHFQIIENLTAGWQDGDGRTLFLVGDPMQSIYRFREAEVGLFLRMWAVGLSNIKLLPLTLTVNFRSDPEIVTWVNRVFAACFPAGSDISRGAVGYADSTAYLPRSPNAGVRIHAFVDDRPGEEASKVADLARDALSTSAEESIAILVRSRQILRDILPALDHAGVQYSGIDIQRLDWEPVVRDLLSLTRALSDPADRVAWLAILRAPWCGLTLHDLLALVGDRDAACVWDRLEDGARIERLSEDGRRRLSRLREPLGQAIENRGRLPLWRAVENLWLNLGGPACAGGDTEENVRTYLDLLRKNGDPGSVEAMVEFSRQVSGYWAQSGDDTGRRLQIMTLHKAKGLEFDTVIIPGLHKRSRPADTRLLLWEEQLQMDEQSLLFAPSTQTGDDTDPHYRYLSKLHVEKDHFETLRLLYVGCTRARNRLHLLASVVSGEETLKAPHGSSLLSKLWPALYVEFEEAARGRPAIAEPGSPTTRVLTRLPADWRLPDLAPPVDIRVSREGSTFPDEIEFSWAGETARHVGVVVHATLDRVARDGIEQWNENRLAGLRRVWRTELLRQGVPEQDAQAASARVLEALTRVLLDERAAWLFSTGHQDACNEYAISWSSPDGVRNMRIDRTFIDSDGSRWIVDYKSSTHEGAGLQKFLDSEQERYKPQLEGYARAAHAMDPRPIRLGLYFPMFTGWRAWEFET